MKCFLFFSPLIAIPPRSWSYHALDHPQGISNAGSFSPAQRCSQWHIFISGGGSREGAACVWTVWSPYRIQEMSLPSLWQTSCSHGFESSQLDGRLCKSGPRDVHPPPGCPHTPQCPCSLHLTVAFIIPVTWERTPQPLCAGHFWMSSNLRSGNHACFRQRAASSSRASGWLPLHSPERWRADAYLFKMLIFFFQW